MLAQITTPVLNLSLSSLWLFRSGVGKLWFMVQIQTAADFFFLILWLHPWHMEVPLPGTESKPKLQLQQKF